MEEREILENCLRGDGESFRGIMEMYQAKAMAAAMNILGHREDAEDACQDAFLQAFRSLGRFDLSRNFKTWFLTILYRRCLDQAKKKNRFRRFLSRFKKEASFCSSLWNSPSSAGTTISANILRRLSPKERGAISLWANEGLTADEISAILGCRPSTARVYLFNARKKIKALLEK